MNPSRLLELRNPHSILAVLKSRPQAVREVRLRNKAAHGAWSEVVSVASRNGVPVSANVAREPKGKSRGKRQTERTGAGVAMVAPPEPVDIPALLRDASNGSLLLALDCLQDPQNVGAIFRSAAFFGVKGILITKDKSVSITDTVCDIAAGGTESVPFAMVTNLAQALETARQASYWILGTSEHAERGIYDVDDRPWVVVIGNEQSGLRRLTLDNCDETCRFHPAGDVTSLNASAATSAALAVLTRSR